MVTAKAWAFQSPTQPFTSSVTSDRQLSFILKWRKYLPREMAVKTKIGLEQRVPSDEIPNSLISSSEASGKKRQL